jgi:flagellar FliJ protein
MRKFRLSSVLRARQAQEDAARGAVLRARSDAARAADKQARSEHALAEHDVVEESESIAFVAAQAARQALAAEIAAASRATAAALGVVDQRMDELTVAAIRRRSVERLAERHAEDVRREDARSGQNQLDELAGTRHGSDPDGGER